MTFSAIKISSIAMKSLHYGIENSLHGFVELIDRYEVREGCVSPNKKITGCVGPCKRTNEACRPLKRAKRWSVDLCDRRELDNYRTGFSSADHSCEWKRKINKAFKRRKISDNVLLKLSRDLLSGVSAARELLLHKSAQSPYIDSQMALLNHLHPSLCGQVAWSQIGVPTSLIQLHYLWICCDLQIFSALGRKIIFLSIINCYRNKLITSKYSVMLLSILTDCSDFGFLGQAIMSETNANFMDEAADSDLAVGGEAEGATDGSVQLIDPLLSVAKRKRDNLDDFEVENDCRLEAHSSHNRRIIGNSVSDRALNTVGTEGILLNSMNDRKIEMFAADWNMRLETLSNRSTQQERAMEQIANSVCDIKNMLNEIRRDHLRDLSRPLDQPNADNQPGHLHRRQPVNGGADFRQPFARDNGFDLGPPDANVDRASLIRNATGYVGERLYEYLWEHKEDETLTQMFIAPGNYPNDIADAIFCTELRNSLGSVNNSIVEGCTIILRGTDSKQGVLIVNCGNLGTTVWVRNFAIAKHLNCGLPGDLELAPTFKVWTQNPAISFESLRAELAPYVQTDRWRLIKTYSEKIGSRFLFVGEWSLKMQIDNYLDEIQRRGKRVNNEMKVYCSSYSVPVAIHYLSSPFGNNEGNFDIFVITFTFNFHSLKRFDKREIMLWKLQPISYVPWSSHEEHEMAKLQTLSILKMPSSYEYPKEIDLAVNVTMPTYLRKLRIVGTEGDTVVTTNKRFSKLHEFLMISVLWAHNLFIIRCILLRFNGTHKLVTGALCEKSLFSVSIARGKSVVFSTRAAIFCDRVKIMDKSVKSKLHLLLDLFKTSLLVDMSNVEKKENTLLDEDNAMNWDEDLEKELRDLTRIDISDENYRSVNADLSAERRKAEFLAMLREQKKQQAEGREKKAEDNSLPQVALHPENSHGPKSLKRKFEPIKDLVFDCNLGGMELQNHIRELGNLDTDSAMYVTAPGYPSRVLDESQCKEWVVELNKACKLSNEGFKIKIGGTDFHVGTLVVRCRNLYTVDTLMNFCNSKDLICVPRGSLIFPKAYRLFVPQTNESFDDIRGALSTDFNTESWVKIRNLFSRKGTIFQFISADGVQCRFSESRSEDEGDRFPMSFRYLAFRERGEIRQWFFHNSGANSGNSIIALSKSLYKLYYSQTAPRNLLSGRKLTMDLLALQPVQLQPGRNSKAAHNGDFCQLEGSSTLSIGTMWRIFKRRRKYCRLKRFMNKMNFCLKPSVLSPRSVLSKTCVFIKTSIFVEMLCYALLVFSSQFCPIHFSSLSLKLMLFFLSSWSLFRSEKGNT